MPGYTFPRDHADALRSGEQVATLGAPRIDGAQNRHARLGDTVTLMLARKGKDRVEKLAERTCILRARLALTADALPRALNVEFRSHDEHEPEAERIARLIQNAETGAPGDLETARDQLANVLGFRTWERLFQYAADQGRGGKAGRPERIDRELIAWSAS